MGTVAVICLVRHGRSGIHPGFLIDIHLAMAGRLSAEASLRFVRVAFARRTEEADTAVSTSTLIL